MFDATMIDMMARTICNARHMDFPLYETCAEEVKDNWRVVARQHMQLAVNAGSPAFLFSDVCPFPLEPELPVG